MPDDRSLRDELEAAFGAEDDAPKNDSTTEKPEASDPPADKTDPPERKAEERVPADKSDKAEKPDEKDKKPAYSYREPPSRWSKEAKEQWAKAFGALDMENPTHKQIGALRDLMFQRAHETEEQHAARVAEFEATAKRYEGLSKVVEPFRAAIEQSGSTVERELGELLKINTFATQRPDEFVRWFVQSRGLNPAQLFAVAGAAPAAPQQQGAPDDDDPLGLIPQHYKQAVGLVPQLTEKIAALERQLGQFGGQFQSFAQSAQERERSQAAEYVASWSQEKDGAGNLLRPHYSDPAIKNAMLQMLERGIHTDINAAYEAAVWANPTTRQAMLDSQHAARVAEAERKQREQAAQKRVAAASVGGRAPTAPPAVPAGNQNVSLRDQLAAQWDELLAG